MYLANYKFICKNPTQVFKGYKNEKPFFKKYKNGDEVSLLDLAGIDGVWSQERTDRKGNKTSFTCYKHFVFELVFKMAGLEKTKQKWVQLGDVSNSFVYVREYEVVNKDEDGRVDKIGWAIGEANPDQARRSVGLSYMADKRAFDRAIIDWLGAIDVYSELENEELSNNPEVNKPTLDSIDLRIRKMIAPFVQEIALAKNIEQLEMVGEQIKTWKEELEEEYKDNKEKFPTNGLLVLKDIYSTKLLDLKGLYSKKEIKK